MARDYDVVVLGGGPGGTTAATVAAMDGRRVLLLERDRFPRHRIGESLLPATVHGICRFLGVSRALERAGFVRKYGATFRWGARPEPWSVGFAEAGLGSDNGGQRRRPLHAYQVERSKFDAILLDNARRRGVRVREGRRVREVLFADGRARGVSYLSPRGKLRTVEAAHIIDASGSASILAERIGQRRYDPFFANVALYGYFVGADRQSDPGRRGNVISAAFDRGWIWFIPLSDRLTSVGVVLRREEAARIQRLGRRRALIGCINECPFIAELLRTATLNDARGPLGQLHVVKDYSYTNTRLWAPGAVLVGDAAMFIDPLFSSGVHLATYSGLLAARSINTIARGRLDEAEVFAEFDRRYRREFARFYEFLVSFYELNADPDSYFWRARTILGAEDDSARAAFVRLVSGLAEGDPVGLQTRKSVLDRLAADTRRLQGLSGAVKLSRRDRAELAERTRARGGGRSELLSLGLSATDVAAEESRLVPSRDGLRWKRRRSNQPVESGRARD